MRDKTEAYILCNWQSRAYVELRAVLDKQNNLVDYVNLEDMRAMFDEWLEGARLQQRYMALIKTYGTELLNVGTLQPKQKFFMSVPDNVKIIVANKHEFDTLNEAEKCLKLKAFL